MGLCKVCKCLAIRMFEYHILPKLAADRLLVLDRKQLLLSELCKPR